MAIPAADTDLLIVIRAIQETITDTKIPGTQAETHPLSEVAYDFRYRCFQYIRTVKLK